MRLTRFAAQTKQIGIVVVPDATDRCGGGDPFDTHLVGMCELENTHTDRRVTRHQYYASTIQRYTHTHAHTR